MEITPKEWGNILERVRYNDPSLTDLNLYGKAIGPEKAKLLADALRRNDNVISLNLWSNHIGNSGFSAIAKALINNRSVKIIDLYHNNIGDKITEELVDLLNSNSSITSLNLGSNKFSDSMAIEISKVLKNESRIRLLNLGTNQIGNDGGIAIAQALQVNQHLESIILFQNELQDSAAIAIAKMLKINKKLNQLNLGDTKIFDAGGKLIAESLKLNRTLKGLDLDFNLIGDGTALSFAEALRTNKTLEFLNLKNNKIQNSGAKAIAEALRDNFTLSELHIEGNKIEEDGVEAIANMLKINNTLTILKFTDKGLTKKSEKLLLDALECNFTLLHTDSKCANLNSLLNRNIKVCKEDMGRIIQEFKNSKRISKHDDQTTLKLFNQVSYVASYNSLSYKSIRGSDSFVNWFPQNELSTIKNVLEKHAEEIITNRIKSIGSTINNCDDIPENINAAVNYYLTQKKLNTENSTSKNFLKHCEILLKSILANNNSELRNQIEIINNMQGVKLAEKLELLSVAKLIAQQIKDYNTSISKKSIFEKIISWIEGDLAIKQFLEIESILDKARFAINTSNQYKIKNS